MKTLSIVKQRPSLSLDILSHLRNNDLYSGIYGGPDELLLHSGGPSNDLAKRSLLMGPPTVRYLVRQSHAKSKVRKDSALKGDINLQNKPKSIEIQIEDWDNGWKKRTVVKGVDLADGLRQLSFDLPTSQGDEFQAGGLAGLLTYDLVQHTEPLALQHVPALESILMVLYRADRWIIHNRIDSKIEFHSSISDDKWITDAEKLIKKGIPNRPMPPVPQTRIPVSETDASHAQKVRITQEAIREGTLYQLNYGRIWCQEIDDPWHIFERLDKDNPAPLSAWLSSPDLKIAISSSSPELLLKQDGPIVSTRPIKGTRPRGDDFEHDANLRGELVGSRKEISEHLMLVDLERNDLGRICLPGSVHWKRWRIESYPHVQHMVSEVEGNLSPEMDGFDALQSVFPGGSITGCPKSATIAAIDELEATPRRAWTGSIGHIDPRTGQSQWNILIRTLEARFEDNRWNATVQAGGGLVIGSDPWREVDEAKWKAQAICQAAWNYSPAGETIHTPIGSISASIHPIPPVTPSVQRLIESQDAGLIRPAPPSYPSPIQWHENLKLEHANGSRILFVDNLDSFSWNIVHAFSTLGAEVVIVPGRLNISDSSALIESVKPTHIVLGPGPGRPEHSELTMAFANAALAGETPPLLGVCLGHQAIGLAAGWKLGPTEFGAVHGVPDGIIFDGEHEIMTRYHSLALTPTNDLLQIIATDSSTDSLVMGVTHPSHSVTGVQFHPESAGSVEGLTIFKDFLAQ